MILQIQKYRTRMCGLLIACLAVIGTGRLQAASEIRETMRKLAESVLKKADGHPVVVGIFSPTALLRDSNSGPGLEAELKTALENLKPGSVAEDPDHAKYEIRGTYAYIKLKGEPQAAQGFSVIKLKASFVEIETDKPLTDLELEFELNHTASLGTITQFNASLPPEGSKLERQQILDEARLHPSVCLDGSHPTRIRAAKESPYAVELLVKSADAGKAPAGPRQVEMVKGQPFVDIQKNDVYEVKIYNDSQEEVAASLSVDGVDVFHFARERAEDGTPKYNHFIIPPHGTHTIVGWYQKLEGPDNYLSFLVTDYGQGAISKSGMKSRGQVGVIQVRLAKVDKSRGVSKSRGGDTETGFGAPVTVKQQAVERSIDPPHEFISIRYHRP